VRTGQVWIDNKSYGYAPVRGVQLRPGKHIVGGGGSRQEVQRQVILHAGERTQVALNLDKGSDDATGSPGDR
jgi:hypothetical protein